MTATGSQASETLAALEIRLRTILPEEYQDCYEDVEPVSMGSASLKYAGDGKVAWNQIWKTFCDLAMAGGPPHKGTFLEPGSPPDIAAQPDRYREAQKEICRGVSMATGLIAESSQTPGWVRVECGGSGMAGWLVRAVVMENIAARCDGTVLELPAGPHYRVAKEIKNVITAIAKTCHYWQDHISPGQQVEIADLFARMGVESPLLQPSLSDNDLPSEERQTLRRNITEAIQKTTGLRASNHRYPDWLGLDCRDVRAAIWMMRALVVSNVLSRREGTVLFIPLNPGGDPNGEAVVRLLTLVHGFARERGIV